MVRFTIPRLLAVPVLQPSASTKLAPIPFMWGIPLLSALTLMCPISWTETPANRYDEIVEPHKHYSGRDPGRSAQDYQKYLGIRSASCLVKYRLGWNVYSHVTMQLSQYEDSYNQCNTNIGSYGTSISYENKTITAACYNYHTSVKAAKLYVLCDEAGINHKGRCHMLHTAPSISTSHQK